jgi:TRAP transporter TAXI family solute receptor
MHRRNSVGNSNHRLLMLIGTILLLFVLGWTTMQVVAPAFQTKVVITTGADKGIYRGFADRYAPILKRDGVTLDIRSSTGSLQNYERLANPDSEYDVGFIQSGTTSPKETDQLQTIAAVSYEPIWVFYRGDATVDQLSQLRGKRISIGVPGSGLLNVAHVLLDYSGITKDNATLVQLDAGSAYQGLKNGELDAAFFIGRPDAPMQQTLLNSDLKLMSFAQADALVQRFPSLSKVTFPRASTSIVEDRPKADVTLLAATALLVAKESVHPAIIYLLLEAAREVHGKEDYFASTGTFPNLNTEEFPISSESTRYFQSGRPFLHRYLPFWLVSFIERRLLILLPFAAALAALVQALPRLVEARVKKPLEARYRELKSLEDEIWDDAQPAPETIARWREAIDSIDERTSLIRVPQRYLKDVYALKQAISVVRNRIPQDAARPAR